MLSKYFLTPLVLVFGAITLSFAKPKITGDWIWVSGSSAYNTQGNLVDLGSYSTFSYPRARSRHCTLYSQALHSLILFGGLSDSSTYLNDLWVFDIATQRWMWLWPAAGTGPAPRAGMGCVLDAGGNLW